MNWRPHRGRIGALLLAAGLAAALAGCGKKAGLEPPPGEATRFPRIYPKPAAAAPGAPAPQQPPSNAPSETLTLPPQILPLPQ